MSSYAFSYSEQRFCDVTGLSRGNIKAIRDGVLREDRDWKKIGGEVALSAAGIKRLWRSLETRPRAFDLASCLVAPREKKNGANGSQEIRLGTMAMPVPVLMNVTRVCANPGLLWAQRSEGIDRSTHVVWVGRNSNFVPGMKIRVAPKPDAPAMWRFLGSLPQRRYTPDEWSRRQAAGMHG